jgi:tRNA pseudouridine38-40 synthase
VALTVAGRTDAGVHAIGQVAHCDVASAAWEAHGGTLLRALAGVLSHDVRVRSVAVAPPGFDARFSALLRRYAYRISDADWGAEPLRRHDTAVWPRSLDVAAMQAASQGLVGMHDFAAFCRRREGATTIRTLLSLDCTRDPDDVVVVRVAADAFCHSMVRSLVGALVAVGEGRKPVTWPAEQLASRERIGSAAVAPARGLTLVAVEYPRDDELAARAAEARNVRALGR